MEKHIEYYNNKVKTYRTLGQKASLLKPYFYLQERYYYNETKSSIEYKEFNKIYEYIFKYLIPPMDNLGIATIEDIFAYCSFLLDSGLLAYDRNMEYKNSGIGSNEIPILSPLVLNRHGKCRHNTSLLQDLINQKGFNAYILVGIKEDLKDLLKHQAIDKTTPNHALTVAEDSEYSYILDPSVKEAFNYMYDGEIYSNNLSKFTLCEGRIVPLGDKMYFDLTHQKPIKEISKVMARVNETTKRLSNHSSYFEYLHEEIKPALLDAEKVYQRILNHKEFI